MNIDLDKEILILIENVNSFLSPYVTYNYNTKKPFLYKKENYVITLPYNFLNENSQNNIDLIRKLSMINAVYVKYFFREDNVLDEYHVSQNEFRNNLILMCEGHIFKNLAIDEFINIAGKEIFSYMTYYEKLFYQALIKEKMNYQINFQNLYEDIYQKYLCYKVMPLCTVLAAYCLKTKQRAKIKLCEDMVVSFQIASQIMDDLKDLKKDIILPDKSALIKAYQFIHPNESLEFIKVKEFLLQNKVLETLFCKLREHLQISKSIAAKLNFNIFFNNIDNYIKIVNTFKI